MFQLPYLIKDFRYFNIDSYIITVNIQTNLRKDEWTTITQVTKLNFKVI